MKTYLFVDGYNIIGAWPELIELRDASLEEARKKLVDYLTEYAVASGYHTVLVFDGWRVKGNRGTVVDILRFYLLPKVSRPTWPLSGWWRVCQNIRKSM